MARRISEILTILASGEDGGSSVYDIFAQIFTGVDERLAAIENISASLVELQADLARSADEIVAVALDPVIATIAEKASLGALLTASSVSEATVSLGVKSFFIAPAGARAMFAPAYMLTITATDDAAVTMYARKVSYEVETGELVVEVLAAFGAGTRTSWTIAPGSLAAMANAISVASVSGEIPGPTLQAALGQIGAALENRQPLDDTLTALAGLSLTNDKVIGTNAAGNPAQFPVSSFGKTLLATGSGEALRSSLQVAPLVSPALSGTPTAPTASTAADSNQIANITAVRAAVAGLVASSPAALDTLQELAAALGNDANFAATITTALAEKQPLAAALTSLAAAASGTNKADLRIGLGAVFGGVAPFPSAAGLGLSDGTFNDITAPGVYTIAGIWTDGPSGAGAATYSGLLEVRTRSLGNFFVQTYRATTGRVYRRIATAPPAWGEWTVIELPALGSVSQSSGVPTGALIERGSNANGEYVKFADGTLICFGEGAAQAVDTASGGLFRTAGSSSWTYPAAFVSVPVGICNPRSSVRWGALGTGITSATYIQVSATTSATAVASGLAAIGRWF